MSREWIEEVKKHFMDKYLLISPSIEIGEGKTSHLTFENGNANITIVEGQKNKGVLSHEITHYGYWPYSVVVGLISNAYYSNKFGKQKGKILSGVIDDIIVDLNMAREDDFAAELSEYYNKISDPNEMPPLSKVFLGFLSYKAGLNFGVTYDNLSEKEKEKVKKLSEINWELGSDKIKNGLRIIDKAGKILEDLIDENDQLDLPFDHFEISDEEAAKALDTIKEDYPEYYDSVRDLLEEKSKRALDIHKYVNELRKYKIKIAGNKRVKGGSIISGYTKWKGDMDKLDPINSLGFLPGDLPGDPILVEMKNGNNYVFGGTYKINDAVIILDTSGSMPSYFPAPQIVSSMLLTKEYILNRRKVGLATFSSETETKDFTDDLYSAYSFLLKEPDGSTKLDINKIDKLINEKQNLDIYLITDSPDGGWINLVDSLEYLDNLVKNNNVTMFWINNELPEISKEFPNINYILVDNINKLTNLVVGRKRDW